MENELKESFCVDGINYNVTGENTVEVGSNWGYEDCCVVIIPAEVTYNGAVYSVTSIGNDAFFECSRLKHVTIPGSVTSIGNTAFCNCYRLRSVTIPDSVTSIGNDVFGICIKLKSVRIPDSVTSIGNGIFYSCTGLVSVTLPCSITSIGDSFFYDCRRLTSVTIPDSVTTIEDSAFYNCRRLESVTIPHSVTTIGERAFYNCRRFTSVTIPDSVTLIGNGAFAFCVNLRSLALPDSDLVTLIEKPAFLPFFSNLTSITIGRSIKLIDEEVFFNQAGLISINFPDFVDLNEYGASSGYTLITVSMPSSVMSVGNDTFSACINLQTVAVHRKIPLSIESSVFKDVNIRKCTLKVPSGSRDAYLAAGVWKDFGTVVETECD